jgi:hypothetical protein
MVVEPQRLDEAMLGQFVTHYGGTVLPPSLKAACRGGPDSNYLPILVRMAMTVPEDGDAGASFADIYRRYFLRLFESQYPDEGQRFARLGEAGNWCLDTYWKDGLRKRAYDASEIERQLMRAGVLISADNRTSRANGQSPPREVQFFHDSMQSYLTAHALASQDSKQYMQLPRPADDDSKKHWHRSRVLLWAAANSKFGGARSDILQTGGSELFQMCLASFAPREGLRQWIRDELLSWAGDHADNLRALDVRKVVPKKLVSHFEDTRGASEILKAAVQESFDADEKADSLNVLGTLYAGIAPLIYDLEEHVDKSGISSVDRRDAL